LKAKKAGFARSRLFYNPNKLLTNRLVEVNYTNIFTLLKEYDISISKFNEGVRDMKTIFKEPARNDPDCEIRLGIASWDNGTRSARSVKYAWLDVNGKVARGGEFPVEALPQALEFAVRNGYLQLSFQ